VTSVPVRPSSFAIWLISRFSSVLTFSSAAATPNTLFAAGEVAEHPCRDVVLAGRKFHDATGGDFDRQFGLGVRQPAKGFDAFGHDRDLFVRDFRIRMRDACEHVGVRRNKAPSVSESLEDLTDAFDALGIANNRVFVADAE